MRYRNSVIPRPKAEGSQNIWGSLATLGMTPEILHFVRNDGKSLLFRCVLVFSLFVLFPLFVWADPGAYAPGEIIHFSVKQGFLKVGNATLEFKGPTSLDGGSYHLIVFTADGIGFFDQEKIYVDKKTFYPYKVMRQLAIPGEKSTIVEEYLPQKGLIQVTKTEGDKTTVQELRKEGAVDNIYGFIYRYRLKAVQSEPEQFAVNLPTVDIKIKSVDSMSFKAAGKIYQAQLLKSDPDKYSLWFDAGPKRLPLRIAGAIGLANTVMTMVGVEQK